MPAFTDLNGIPMTAHMPCCGTTCATSMGFDGVP